MCIRDSFKTLTLRDSHGAGLKAIMLTICLSFIDDEDDKELFIEAYNKYREGLLLIRIHMDQPQKSGCKDIDHVNNRRHDGHEAVNYFRIF